MVVVSCELCQKISYPKVLGQRRSFLLESRRLGGNFIQKQKGRVPTAKAVLIFMTMISDRKPRAGRQFHSKTGGSVFKANRTIAIIMISISIINAIVLGQIYDFSERAGNRAGNHVWDHAGNHGAYPPPQHESTQIRDLQ